MKLKMAEKSLFAILLRSPWWVSVAAAGAIVAMARALLPLEYVPFGAMGAFPLLVIGAIAAARQWRSPSPAAVEQALQRLAAMGWREFAAAVEAGLRREGHTVRTVAELGFEFEATQAGRTVLVAGKRWKASAVGIEPLRALHAQVESRRQTQGAAEGWYLALGKPSEAAVDFARTHRLRLVQGAELARLAGPG